MLLEQVFEVGAHDVPEDDRVRDAHHRGLQLHREEHALALGVLELLGQESLESGASHDRGIDDLARPQRSPRLEHRDLAVGVDVLDAEGTLALHRVRALRRAEVVSAHRRHMGARIRGPLAHRVRMPACVVLDRGGRPAVGVPLAEHRIDRTALDFVVARPDLSLPVVAGLIGVVGNAVSLSLELLDGGLELRHGRADVGQLDDVRLGRLGELTQVAQGVGHPLVLLEPVRELGQDPRGERDIARFDLDPRRPGKRSNDRKQRMRGQRRRLVRERVDDLHGVRHTLSVPQLVERPRQVAPQILHVLQADA